MIRHKEKIKAQLGEFFTEWEKLQAQEDKIRQFVKDDLVTKTVAEGQMLKIDNSRVVLKDYTKAKSLELKEFMLEDITEWEKPKGELLAVDDLKLLDGYISLSSEELQGLGDKHKDNPIMQRALKEYAAKKNITFIASPDGNDKRQVVSSLLQIIDWAMEEPTGYRAETLKEKYVDETLESLLG